MLSGEVPVGRLLDATPGLMSWHRRVLPASPGAGVLDHLVASTAGGFLIEERDWSGSFIVRDGGLARHRVGAHGPWAHGFEDARLDRIRRAAQAVELLITRPVDPVLVLTSTTATFAGPVTVRGVLVLHRADLAGWLAALPERVDRAEVMLTSARMERVSRPAGTARRIPDWQRYSTPARAGRGDRRGAQPLRAAPGPRDYSLPDLLEPVAPARKSCPPPAGPAGQAGRRGAGRFRSAIAVVGLATAVVSAIRIIDHLPGARPAGRPAAGTARMGSCSELAASRISAETGTAVYPEPAPRDTCWYGTVPRTPSSVVVSVAGGSAAGAPAPGLAGWSLTYGAGDPAPDGSGRLLRDPLRVTLDLALIGGDRARGQRLAQAVAGDALAS